MRFAQTVSSHAKELSIKGLSHFRRQFINDKNVTIISNNCWAGWVYRRYGLMYQTPTIGLYFFARDYIEFCKQLDHYIGEKLEFISANESKYFHNIVERKQQSVPIGLLGGKVEIVFLHYQNEKEAYEKWNRRLERIRSDNLVFKFSEMDLCTPQIVEEFDQLPYKKKVCFTANSYPQLASSVPILKVLEGDRVANDTTYYADYIDLTRFLNTGEIVRKKASQRG